jgi:hypothetical protein
MSGGGRGVRLDDVVARGGYQMRMMGVGHQLPAKVQRCKAPAANWPLDTPQTQPPWELLRCEAWVVYSSHPNVHRTLH